MWFLWNFLMLHTPYYYYVHKHFNLLGVDWLIILPPGVGWYIMGYKSEPLPSYHKWSNCSYSIKLSYTTPSSTPKVHLRCLGTTILPTVSSPAFSPPPCPAHIWVGRPTFPIWSPAASLCSPWWVVSLWLFFPPLPRGTSTLRLPRVSPSSLWSVAPPRGVTPSGPWSFTPEPTSSCCRTRAPTAPPTYTSLPRPAPLLPSFTSPSPPFLTASDISEGFGILPLNRCYCRQLSVLGMKKPLMVVGYPHLSGKIPYHH